MSEQQEESMRHTPRYLMTDPQEVARLIRNHPWATFVSATSTGLVASHYPVLLDEAAATLTVLSHFGRPDDELHELGQHQMLVIIQGPHDYVSPSWYPPGDLVPTWNHVTAHLYGTPEILSEGENYAVLSRLTDHFEQHRPGGRSLHEDESATRRAARGTTGLRLRVNRFEARAKLSQNKPAEVRTTITTQLAKDNLPSPTRCAATRTRAAEARQRRAWRHERVLASGRMRVVAPGSALPWNAGPSVRVRPPRR